MFLRAGCSLFRSEGFCSFMEAYGKLQFLIKKYFFFSAVNFFLFLVIKTMDPDWIRIRIGIQPKMLDPDQMHTDPKRCPYFFLRGWFGCCSGTVKSCKKVKPVFRIRTWTGSLRTVLNWNLASGSRFPHKYLDPGLRKQLQEKRGMFWISRCSLPCGLWKFLEFLFYTKKWKNINFLHECMRQYRHTCVKIYTGNVCSVRSIAPLKVRRKIRSMHVEKGRNW